MARINRKHLQIRALHEFLGHGLHKAVPYVTIRPFAYIAASGWKLRCADPVYGGSIAEPFTSFFTRHVAQRARSASSAATSRLVGPMDYAQALARVYEHLEEDAVEKAVMGCLRIARAAKDHLNAAIFLRELYPNKREVARALYDDTAHLNKEQQKFLYETSLNRWLELHTMDFVLSNDPDEEDLEEGDRHTIVKVAAGELQSRLNQWERPIADMTLPPGMGTFDTAAFTDRMLHEKATMRLQITALQIVKSRLKARCLNYAIEIERQLELQKKGQGFLEAAQNEVNNFFKARSDDVFLKLQKAAQLAASTDLEDFALLLTEVRRALKAAADFFYPPVAGKVVCADGIERELGEEQYLNRLQEFVARRLARSTSKELLQAEIDHLAVFFRRLNDMASKGVHSAVTLAESRQGLVGLYFFLFNVCQHLSKDEPS